MTSPIDPDGAVRPHVDVFVLNFNGGTLLTRCLESLREQTYPNLTVHLIDNASTDGSLESARAQHPWVRVTAHASNLGFARANNLAVRTSDAEFVAFVNNDAHVDQRWLEHLVDAITHAPDVAACTSRIRFSDHPGLLNHAGATLTYAGNGWDIGFGQLDSIDFLEPSTVGSFSGAACLLRRDAFLKVGGFDDRFFAYFEDTDLSWRLWLMGHRILFVPTAIAYHKYGAAGGGRLSPFRVYHAQRNRLSSLVKNAGRERLLVAIVLSLGFDAYRMWTYLRQGSPALCYALLRGTVAALRELRWSLGARRAIQRSRLRSDTQMERLGVLSSPLEAIREYLRLQRLDAPPPRSTMLSLG